MTKSYYKTSTPIVQGNISESNHYLNLLKKIHESDNPKIGTICGYVGELAKIPEQRTRYEKIIDDLVSIKDDPAKLNSAINCIKEVYQEIFYTQDAEIIQFKGGVDD